MTLLAARLRERAKTPGGTSGALARRSTARKPTISAAAPKRIRTLTAGGLVPAPTMA
jgi:hypothetical protein